MEQPFLNEDNNFFKSFGLDDQGMLKARSHKYLRKEGNKYIYKETDLGKLTDLQHHGSEDEKKKAEARLKKLKEEKKKNKN